MSEARLSGEKVVFSSLRLWGLIPLLKMDHQEDCVHG